ncbi:MAG: hypothetical protein EP343_33495 [Deltaproteobacteria bacterium]|nr:MAG: hypothetical protein EP343_33495 [Deltaproteobacteria bacterium]
MCFVMGFVGWCWTPSHLELHSKVWAATSRPSLAQQFLQVLRSHRNQNVALGHYSLISSHPTLVQSARRWATTYALQQKVLDQLPDGRLALQLVRTLQRTYPSIAHAEVLETTSLDPRSWLKAWFQKSSARRALEWIGANELGLGVVRTPRHSWLVVLLLGSNSKELLGAYQTGAFVQVKIKKTWKLGVVQAAVPSTRLHAQRCSAMSASSSCYVMQDLRVVVHEPCSAHNISYYLRRKPKDLRPAKQPMPRFKRGAVVAFSKYGKWDKGVVAFQANLHRGVPLHYGIATKGTHDMICASHLRPWNDYQREKKAKEVKKHNKEKQKKAKAAKANKAKSKKSMARKKTKLAKKSKPPKKKPLPQADVRWSVLWFRPTSRFGGTLELGGVLANIGKRTAKIELLVEAERPKQKKPKPLRRFVTFFAPRAKSSFVRYIPFEKKLSLYRLTILVNGQLHRTVAVSALPPLSKPSSRPTSQASSLPSSQASSLPSTRIARTLPSTKNTLSRSSRRRESKRKRWKRLQVVFPQERLREWPWFWIWPM